MKYKQYRSSDNKIMYQRFQTLRKSIYLVLSGIEGNLLTSKNKHIFVTSSSKKQKTFAEPKN